MFSAPLVVVLEPASIILKEFETSSPPALGSLLVCNLEADVVALAEAHSLHSRAPWCPISVVIPPQQRIDSRILRAFEPRVGVMVQVIAEWSRIRADPTLLGEAVMARAMPSGAAMGEYVRNRTSPRKISNSLEICLASGLSDDSSAGRSHRSTLSRHLSTFGPLKPHDWAAVGQVVRALCTVRKHRPGTVESVALAAGLDPRTLRSRLRRYCGCAYNEARTRWGWEWIVESALRNFGYAAPSITQDGARYDRLLG